MFKMKAVDKLVRRYGGLSATARVIRRECGLKVSRQLVYAWQKAGYIPAKYAFEIHKLTDGEISAEEVTIDAREAQKSVEVVAKEVA